VCVCVCACVCASKYVWEQGAGTWIQQLEVSSHCSVVSDRRLETSAVLIKWI
jgi:hypothetical protein